MLRAWGALIVVWCTFACIEDPGELPPFTGAADVGADLFEATDVALDIAPDAAGAPETCNGRDDDGDGQIDEDVELPPPSDDHSQDGGCRPRIVRCIDGGLVTTLDRFEANESSCDGLDNDCDGEVDEGHLNRCTWCDGQQATPPCNGCPDRTTIPSGFVCVPAGQFTMGSPSEDPAAAPDEQPQHTVRFERPYLVSIVEVTQGRWQGPANGRLPDNPAWFSSAADGRPCRAVEPGRCPLERVSWYDALWLANLASEADGLEPCYALADCVGDAYGGCAPDEPDCEGDFTCERVQRVEGCTGYRLPTEAEWERAARGGTDSRYWTGDDTNALSTADVFRGNADGRTRPFTEGGPPNGLGLQDVHGNVEEWVFDAPRPYPDPPEPRTDPIALEGAERLARGGSWSADPGGCRSAARHRSSPALRSATRGLRLALDTRPAPLEITASPAEPLDDADGGLLDAGADAPGPGMEPMDGGNGR